MSASFRNAELMRMGNGYFWKSLGNRTTASHCSPSLHDLNPGTKRRYTTMTHDEYSYYSRQTHDLLSPGMLTSRWWQLASKTHLCPIPSVPNLRQVLVPHNQPLTRMTVLLTETSLLVFGNDRLHAYGKHWQGYKVSMDAFQWNDRLSLVVLPEVCLSRLGSTAPLLPPVVTRVYCVPVFFPPGYGDRQKDSDCYTTPKNAISVISHKILYKQRPEWVSLIITVVGHF